MSSTAERSRLPTEILIRDRHNSRFPHGGHRASGALQDIVHIEREAALSLFFPRQHLSLHVWEPAVAALLDPLVFLELGEYAVDNHPAWRVVETAADVGSSKRLSLQC